MVPDLAAACLQLELVIEEMRDNVGEEGLLGQISVTVPERVEAVPGIEGRGLQQARTADRRRAQRRTESARPQRAGNGDGVALLRAMVAAHGIIEKAANPLIGGQP